jgi:hypothetical protein
MQAMKALATSGLVCVLTIACSAAGPGNSPGASGGPDGGAPGTGPDGGALGSDGGGGGPVGDSGLTTDQACTTAGMAVCGKISACSPFLLQENFGDVATCSRRFALSCAAQLEAPGMPVGPDFVSACYAALAAGTCADYFAGVLPPACKPQPAGTRAVGDVCMSNWQCANDSCRTTEGSQCGTCAALATVGQSCATADCEPGLFCNTNHYCHPYGAVGTACNTEHPCRYPLTCKAGLCAAGDTLGATCVTSPQTCDLWHGLLCNPVTKKCDTIVQVQAGAVCGVGTDGIAHACTGGASCNRPSMTATSGTCVAPAADGQACNATNGPYCTFPAVCVSGTCTPPGATTCK